MAAGTIEHNSRTSHELESRPVAFRLCCFERHEVCRHGRCSGYQRLQSMHKSGLTGVRHRSSQHCSQRILVVRPLFG